jgi:hypothetical protein
VAPPSPDQLVAGAIQKLKHVMKEYMRKMDAKFNSLTTLITKII